jgi:lysophospholipase L1-like esterase
MPAENDTPHIVIVGDSTVATNREGNPSHGWGGVIHAFFTQDVTIINLAAGGRSSKSFIGEGRWEKALTHPADYILIQFGHNDCPGKGPERETNPETDFRDYLRKYVDDSRAIGAVPILITSVTRRRFDNEGNIRTILGAYAEGARVVAKEKEIACLDLHTKSIDMFNRLGDEGSTYISATPEDRTHFSAEGAKVIAKLVIEELSEKVRALKPYLQT